MNEEHKKQYLDKYYQAKQKGVKFFPDIIYKDLLIVFAIFIILIMLGTFIGVKNEPRVDPNDSAYVPRPEWYFLFLFQMLKYFPGEIEWVGTTVVPGLAVLVLFLLPFIDRNPYRHFSKRKIGIGVMSLIVLGMVFLTVQAAATTPPSEEADTLASSLSEEILAGSDLYSIQCVECHGGEGEGGEIKGVEGLEGVIVNPINSQDMMYTRTDETLYNIIDYGQPNLQMPPFGTANGGELGPGEMRAIVTFMRYTWDDRAELPQEVTAASAIPVLGPDEIPSYEVHVAPIFKRYCISCHRPGKENQNNLMQTYDEVMNTGDNAPNVIPGDLMSNLIRMINREDIDAGGPMPPTKGLKPELIEILTRWVLGGAPNTAAEAAAAAPAGVAPSEVVPSEVITTTLTAPDVTAIPEATTTPAP
ncbi:MAG: c-type cytochrome [Anaerolineales bacterium]|nr:c-type cytochrome [Anaerolineales bacterium]